MIAEKAVIGGEGNGGVMWPKVHPVRDSLVGIALTLQNMAESGKTINQLADELPKYYIVKEKIACPQKDSFGIMEKVKKLYEKEKVETVDGITITKNGIRISIRPSNTEPIFRIFAESNSHKKSLKVALEIKKVIAGLLKRIV
jgi:phosphomannomutase